MKMLPENHTQNTSNFHLNVTHDGNMQLRNFGPLAYILAGATLFCVTLSWILNGIVILAINRIGQDRLKMKFLMTNAVLSDILLSVGFGARVIFQLLGIDDQEDGVSLGVLCANTVYDLYAYFATFYQIFSSMALALDRFYCILMPLSYHTMKYSAPVKLLSILVILTVALSLTLPVKFLKLKPGDLFITVCHKAEQRGEYTENFLPFVILSAVFVTLVIHCSILGIVAWHRHKSQGALGEQHDGQRALKKQTPLAVTFFLIHLSYVAFYVPGALYFSVLTESLQSMPNLNFYLSQTVIIIYLLNTIVDPLIYIFRIRSIHACVNRMLCQCWKKHYRPNLGTACDTLDESGRTTSVAMISTF